MALLGWVVAAVLLTLYAVIAYALYQRRVVKVGLKVPFASFFFEATGQKKNTDKDGSAEEK